MTKEENAQLKADYMRKLRYDYARKTMKHLSIDEMAAMFKNPADRQHYLWLARRNNV